jgi:hypothetical protein
MDIITTLQTAAAAGFMDLKTCVMFAIINVGTGMAVDAVSNAVPFGGYPRIAAMETTRSLGDVTKFITWSMVSNSTSAPSSGTM